VLAKRFVFTTWQSFHTLITTLCDAHPVTFTPTNELVAQVTRCGECVWVPVMTPALSAVQTLYRIDVVGRFVLRAYFVQWQWDSLSDT
jgi:hypothetical protein